MPLLAHLDIVNAAYARIGEDPIQSFDEETFGGQQAALIYEPTIAFNIGVYPFGFAKKIVALSVNSAIVPLSGFTAAFDLAPEALGLPLYVTDDPTEPDRRFDRYALIGNTLQADCNPIYAMIKFLPDPSRWTATFKQASTTALAAKYAISVANDRALADQLERQAYGAPQENYRGGEMGAAIREDSFATPPRRANWAERNPLVNSWRS